MDPKSYRWMPVEGVDGVEEKALATFTDCKIRCAYYRLLQGADFKAEGRGILLVLSGRGSIQEQTFRRFTSIYLDSRESVFLKASEVCEMVFLGMPDVARIMKQQPAGASWQAAE
jgi:hypothetical protein